MENSKYILFVVNPISGGINKEELINTVKNRLEREDIPILIYKTTGRNDPMEIQKFLANYTIDRVFIAGGDGTIKMVAEAMLETTIPLAIFPAGSANGLALNFSLPTSIEEQLEIALGKHFIPFDVLKINDEICLHLADFGVNAELIKNYEKANSRGKLGYFLQSIPTLIQSDYPFHFKFKTDKGQYSKEGLVLAIANCQQYGTGANINPTGSVNDGKFELVLFKSLHLGQIIKTIAKPDDLDPDFAETYTTTTAKISCPIKVPFQIDGEFYGNHKELDVSVLEKALKFLTPQHEPAFQDKDLL